MRMDRRATIATLFGQPPAKAKAESRPRPIVHAGLAPYSGTWGYEQAAHLLRRSMFGPTDAQIKTAAEQGLGSSLARLFEESPLPEPPINDRSDDPNVPIGETWVDAHYDVDVRTAQIVYRNRTLQAWTMLQLFKEGISIREQLTLFWHNHFGVAGVNDPRFRYRHASLLRSFAWGNFRELIKQVTVDPIMLRFLNGNQNTLNAPNDNYARELLELFTIGKGPQVSPGDYTNYTEDDVLAISRVLTGWRDRGYVTANPDLPIHAQYRNNQHDLGDKQLSYRFDNIVIPNMGDQEYAHLIDVIFQKDEVARFICRKLYRWFVYYHIDEAVEEAVIQPMAQLLIDSDYEIRPALMALLGSEHFYETRNLGPMIKNPLAFIFSAVKPLGLELPEDLSQQYTTMIRLFSSSQLQQMEYYNPPDVAGWKPYYQEPMYYRIWTNATTLPARMDFVDVLLGNGFNVGFGLRVQFDPLAFVATLENPFDPNELVEDFSRILLPQPLTEGQKAALKEVLLPGLPDYEWTVEYADYLSDPGNVGLSQAVSAKLRQLLQAMLSMPEFQLS